MLSNQNNKTCVFTIVAPNYFGQALTLRESLKHYDIDFKVVVVSELGFNTNEFEVDEIIYSTELAIKNYISKAFQFNILEHCTNIKPSCFQHIVKNFSYDFIYYIDPDIFFYSTPENINSMFGDSTVLLTPHTMTPVLDDHRPTDLEFLRTGIFNLGFIGIRPSESADNFLNWWSNRCLEYGFNDTSSGLFVDQKWMDLSIVYFSNVLFTTYPGLNVAYWNLHERSVTCQDGIYLVNSQPLIFFHYSGLDPLKPEALSKHQSRLIVKLDTPLHELVTSYSIALLENSKRNINVVPYTKFTNGVQVTDLSRRFYWKESNFKVYSNPFDSNCEFYRIAVDKSYVSAKRTDYKSVSALSDMSQYSLRISIINTCFKIALKVLGPSNYFMLIRFLKQRFSMTSDYYEC